MDLPKYPLVTKVALNVDPSNYRARIPWKPFLGFLCDFFSMFVIPVVLSEGETSPERPLVLRIPKNVTLESSLV